jgi:hypothetical protein
MAPWAWPPLPSGRQRGAHPYPAEAGLRPPAGPGWCDHGPNQPHPARDAKDKCGRETHRPSALVRLKACGRSSAAVPARGRGAQSRLLRT